MKQLFVLVGSFIILFSSCSTENKNENTDKKSRTNLLLNNTVPVSQLFSLDSAVIPLWQKEISNSKLIEKLFKKINESGITAYDPSMEELVPFTKEDILRNMGTENSPDLSEIRSVFFNEEWFLDTTDEFIFEKNVISWEPVRYYKKSMDADQSEMLKKKVCKLSQGNPTELLAKNVIYEFDIQDSLYPTFTKNIDAEKLTTILVNYALSGKVKLWSPMDINVELTKNEVETKLGQVTDTIYIENPETGEIDTQVITFQIDPLEIKSIIFVEDWYYDPSTFAIKKVITGLGPVRHFYKSDNEKVKSIVYMLYTGKDKTNIF